MFRNALIIGLGLMGGSLAAVFRKKRLAETICGYDISEAIMEKALRTHLIDKKVPALAEAVIDADVILVCSHLASYSEIGQIISKFPKADTIITDVGSVKGPALRFESFLTSEQKKNYVSSHPVAGSENSGLSAIKIDLFDKKKVIITPLENSSPRTVQTLCKMWKNIGSVPEIMTGELHDIIYASVSHVPQFLSFCFADFLSRAGQHIENPEENFLKFTRLAASNPTLWQDIFLANNKNISKVLADFYLNFSNIIREIGSNQEDELLERYGKTIKTRSAMKEDIAYRETDLDTANFDIICAIPRVIALAFMEIAGNFEYAGPGFMDFTRIIISDPQANVDYLVKEKDRILELLKEFFDCMDNFYKIIERNTKPEIFLKMRESRNNYLECVKIQT